MPTVGETLSLSRSPLNMVSPNKAVKKHVSVKSSLPHVTIVKPLLSKQKMLKRKQKREELKKKAAKQQSEKKSSKPVPKVSSGATKKKKAKAKEETTKEPLHIVTPAAIVSFLQCLIFKFDFFSDNLFLPKETSRAPHGDPVHLGLVYHGEFFVFYDFKCII